MGGKPKYRKEVKIGLVVAGILVALGIAAIKFFAGSADNARESVADERLNFPGAEPVQEANPGAYRNDANRPTVLTTNNSGILPFDRGKREPDAWNLELEPTDAVQSDPISLTRNMQPSLMPNPRLTYSLESNGLSRGKLGPDTVFLPSGVSIISPDNEPSDQITLKPTIDSTYRR
jgi:hypothetical protein